VLRMSAEQMLRQVSKTWLSLTLDGQLWRRLDVSALGNDAISVLSVLRTMHAAGRFVRDLNLQGMGNLDDRALSAMVEFALQPVTPDATETRITRLSLKGVFLATHCSDGASNRVPQDAVRYRLIPFTTFSNVLPISLTSTSTHSTA
jgi:hypothetical protein